MSRPICPTSPTSRTGSLPVSGPTAGACRDSGAAVRRLAGVSRLALLAGCGVLAAAAGMGTAAAQSTALVDEVVLVDSSASTSDVTPFIGSTITGIDSRLSSGGISSRYGLTAFRSAISFSPGSNSSTTVPVNIVSRFGPSGTELFGTAAEVAAAANRVTNVSSLVDGYQALEYALTQAGYVSQFRPSAARYVLLATDTYREVQLTSLDAAQAARLLSDNNVRLSALVSANLIASDGSRLAAVFRNAQGQIVGYKIDGSTTPVAFARAVSLDEINRDYIQVALQSGGVVGDLTLIGQGAALEAALSNALLAALVQTVVQPLIPTITEEAISATQLPTVRVQTTAIQQAIASRVRDVLGSIVAARRQSAAGLPVSGAGLAGGDDATGLRLAGWVDGSLSVLNNTQSGNRFNGNTKLALFGFDVLASSDLLLGASIGVENTSLDLKMVDGRLYGNGFTINPYLAYIIDQNFTIDALFSFTRSSFTQRQNFLGIASEGDFAANRYLGAINFSGYFTEGDWNFHGSLGYKVTHQAPDDYTDNLGNRIQQSSVTLQQVVLGGEVAYSFAWGQPYLSTQIEIDTVRQTTTNIAGVRVDPGRVGAILGGGVRFNVSDDVAMGVFATTQVGRSDERNTTAGINARMRF